MGLTPAPGPGKYSVMADTLDPKFLDKRTAARYLRSGALEDKAYERFLKALPDVAEKSMPIETDFDADEDFDEEDDVEETEGEPTP